MAPLYTINLKLGGSRDLERIIEVGLYGMRLVREGYMHDGGCCFGECGRTWEIYLVVSMHDSYVNNGVESSVVRELPRDY